MSSKNDIAESIKESLEQSKKLIYSDFIKVGNWIDVKDGVVWRVAKILEVENGNIIKVTFDGWSHKWD